MSYAEENLEAVKSLESGSIRPFKSMVGIDLVGHFRCVECGKFPLSSRIIEYYKHDVTKTQCYDCQQISKQ